MREMFVEFAGENRRFVGSFAASVEIAQRIGDPLFIAKEVVLESLMHEQGIPYEARWSFTVSNVAETIFIGLKHGESKMTLEDVQNAVFDLGFADAQRLASDYLTLIVGPKPEETATVEGEGASEK